VKKRVVLIATSLFLCISCENKPAELSQSSDNQSVEQFEQQYTSVSAETQQEQPKESSIFKLIKEAEERGELPKLDTSTDLRGEEVDGIRKDVFGEIERRFKEKYRGKGNIYNSILLSAWVDQRLFEIDPTDREQAKHYSILWELDVECRGDSYKEYYIPVIEKRYNKSYPDFLEVKEAAFEYFEGLDEVLNAGNLTNTLTYNTYERVKYFNQVNKSLDGTVNSSIPEEAHRRGLSACQVLEKVKEYWEQGKDINSIDYLQIIDELSKE